VLVLAFASLPLMPARRGKAQAPTTTYAIIDLGTLGGTESVAYGINNCAQVVGDASLSGASPKHPFIWRDANNDGDSDPGEMQDLGTFAGGSGTASAINSSAYVAGDSVAVDPRAFRWHDPGPLESLGVLPGDVISLAYDINDSNQVVGMSESADLTDRAFIWQNASMQAVPTLNSVTPMIARGINNGGRIVGIATNLHAFVHTGSTNIDLGTFGGGISQAYEISDDNRVVGYAETTSPNANVPRRAFIWHDDDADNVSDPSRHLLRGRPEARFHLARREQRRRRRRSGRCRRDA
jgi:probable HAF family extracellular repeat protein